MPDFILKHVPGMATATPVPVLQAESLTEAVFKNEYVAHSRPCVIQGAMRHWPAVQKWRDRDALKKVCGSKDVFFLPHENHVTQKRTIPGRTKLSYADAIDRLFDAQIAAIECNPGNPDMYADFGRLSFFTQADLGLNYELFRFFIFKNAGSAWHYHPLDETLMCQVLGAKKIGLLEVAGPHYKALSRIFYEEDYYEDPAAFDQLKDADLRWHSASLDEGDALYIPPLWWHGVIALRDQVGVTAAVCWRSPPHVIADTLRKMALGHFDLVGPFTSGRFQPLLEAARKLNLERELMIAWERAIAEGLVWEPPATLLS